ncbi:MAG TPA: type I methionyl aminopeptidase [Spirochaetota bacterium]|nr:type I methionyl aminopeptidase [Spirochaetota bacterium]
MIKIKKPAEIKKTYRACLLAAKILEQAGREVKEGVTTLYLNDLIEKLTTNAGARSAPLNYRGFPKSVCTSLNNVVCHGIPSAGTVLKSGDILNIDITVKLDGYHGDTSRTFIIGKAARPVIDLVKRTEKAMYTGIDQIKPGKYFSDIGRAIARYIEPFGYGIVTKFGGHGIGRKFHEPPFVYHAACSKKGAVFKPGMIFTVEPMINMGSPEIYVDQNDQWTVYTKDGSWSAQFEHTVLVTNTGHKKLTLL